MKYRAGPERAKAVARQAYRADPEKFKARTAKYAKEHVKEKRDWRRAWKKAHPEQATADAGMRRALKRKAFPKWASRKEIRAVYAEAREVSRMTGVTHHVDHTYPLTHKLFTGLHVPWNLRVIPAFENYSKNNRVTPGMLSMSFPS